MSLITSVWALFSKRQRLKNDLANIDRKIDQINKQIDKGKRGDTSALLAQRTALTDERMRVAALLAAL